MRKGRASRTAEFVAFIRALGNLAPAVNGFADPMAEHFLPPRFAKQVERARKRLPRSPLPFWMKGMGLFNQFRTAVLDRAAKDAAPFDQFVILGAGLDGRAWRLEPLKKVTVFEVDHPDTQAWKKQKAEGSPPIAREVRFVAMDFARDALAERLSAAGFDPRKKTFWLWEGVTMYLTPADVAKTLSTIAQLSGPGSRVAATYLGKWRGRTPRSAFLALLGEPIRAAFEVAELAALADASGWGTLSNTGIADWLPEYAPGLKLSLTRVGPQWYERIWQGQVKP